MLADVEYFNSRIGKLDGSDNLGTHLLEVVGNKTIIAPPKSAQPMNTEQAVPIPKQGVEDAEQTNDEGEKT
jgi:vacuolar protein sorting-associated protein 54